MLHPPDGRTMEAPWKHRRPHGSTGKHRGSTIETPSKHHGTPHGSAAVLPWKRHESPMEAPWKHHGSLHGSTVLLCKSHRSPHGVTVLPFSLWKHHGSTMKVWKSPWKHHGSPHGSTVEVLWKHNGVPWTLEIPSHMNSMEASWEFLGSGGAMEISL